MSDKEVSGQLAIAASSYACSVCPRAQLEPERAVALVNSALSGSPMRGVWSDAVCAFVAGARFYEHAHRDRIAELEAENAHLRSVFVPPGSALVLVAPEVASQDEMRDAVERASKVHDGPVIMLAHNWKSMPIDELRTGRD